MFSDSSVFCGTDSLPCQGCYVFLTQKLRMVHSEVPYGATELGMCPRGPLESRAAI